LKKPKDIDEFMRQIDIIQEQRKKSQSTFLDEIENEVTKRSDFLSAQQKKYEDIKDEYLKLIEYKCAMQKVKEILSSHLPNVIVEPPKDNSAATSSLHEETLNLTESIVKTEMKIAVVAGVINVSDSDRFKRFIFRITRGILRL